MPPTTSNVAIANHPSENLTISAGVAIFHLATSRVVLCYHTRDQYYFLPKGRKNAYEDVCRTAEREGFEESGYRNRLLPLPMQHRATDGDEGKERWVTETQWMQLLPLGRGRQYVLFWYVGETVPPEVEESYGGERGVYRVPEAFPKEGTLEERIRLDKVIGEDGTEKIYEPVRHEGTGVDEEEALYTSQLVPVEEAKRKLRGSVMEDVVRRGWEGIQQRMETERIEAGVA